MAIVTQHHIQKHILKVLTYTNRARFRDMRPNGVDSNLYNYHLKLLIKENLVVKNEAGYALSPQGMRFADHVSVEKYEYRQQPKVLTKLVCINDDNEIILWPKYKQPFIGRWSLPSGKVHYEDSNLTSAILREAQYLTSGEPKDLQQAGVVEYSVYISDVLVTHTLAFIFTAKLTGITHERARFWPIHALEGINLSPGTLPTIQTVLENKDYFYSQFTIKE
jgi:ADP-ribose pyrophosphatase YjhB (NUDIX family)